MRFFSPAHATALIPHYVNYSQMHGNWKLYITHIFCISFHSPPPSPLERKDRSAPLCVHTFIALPMTPVTLWHQPLIDNQHSCTCSAHTSPPQGRAEDLQIVAAPPFLWHEARELFSAKNSMIFIRNATFSRDNTGLNHPKIHHSTRLGDLKIRCGAVSVWELRSHSQGPGFGYPADNPWRHGWDSKLDQSYNKRK